MKIEPKKIIVMGLGYIGLPTASLLATKGNHVLGVDINPLTVETINRGEIHIVEPDLDILVRSAVHSGNLKAALVPEGADIFILAVPTPFKDDHIPDISYIEAATRTIAPYLVSGNLFILESTSPVGTTERVRDILEEERPDLFPAPSKGSNSRSVYIAHCPERVLPGQILRELITNDRIIGGINQDSREKTAEFYRTFVSGDVFVTDARTAELAKLTENAFRDVNIAFANELSLICDRLGVDVWELIELANRHPRVNILQPGPGVGGHCIAVDPWFIVDAAPEESRLIRIAREVNGNKPEWVINKVKAKAARFKNPVIGCLGLAFKANIDDLRESPALDITRKLIASGIGEVMACEPNVNDGFKEFPLYDLPRILQEADILLVLVDHDDFKTIDREALKEKVVIDTRGIWR
ncbi:MAG: UDP-N-acetyl-D-mannosamine dehydrogenase [Desulfuromonadales bacterium]|nr:UDP-N-acetyl-D-mannosamine dehydrogenase [Desulfuromonadales bacterium]